MEKLSTIQKREKLNEVCRHGAPGPGGAYHDYDIYPVKTEDMTDPEPLLCIQFQRGPRKDPEARHGTLDSDLLEIVRDRFKYFQAGEFATEYNAHALEHLEIALMYMNLRAEDRIERSVLGTMQE